ncbi:hypothetical protein Bca52824_028774 [Brassica carinata]|uniref:Uncharacterized protein n=1 Tax=Brassica carinata TaxID=52824 RepID=A0A8X7VD19_BRACI|nr:hypothetical protein Bca52824_028774 [Brassica carinata]
MRCRDSRFLRIPELGIGQTIIEATLMLATVNVHRLATYVTRCNQNFRLPDSPLLVGLNDSTTFDEITESPHQVECTPPYQLDTPAFEQERRASQAYSGTDDIGAWIAVSDDGGLHKALASHLSDLHEKCPTFLAS